MAKQIKSAPFTGLTKVLGGLCILGWVFFIAALSIFHIARPDPSNLFDTVLDNAVRTEWNPSYGELFYFFMTCGVVLSLSALVLNIYLYKMHRTHVWLSLIILILISIAMLLYYSVSVR
ncbi:hypothetical protein ACR0ST_05245 [Aliidiomarina sp. Khilg15.8]